MSKDEASTNGRSIIRIGIIVAVLITVVFLLVTFFLKLCYMLTWLGATLVYAISLYWLAYEVCRLSVFPGSFWLWLRALERNRSASMCKFVLTKMCAYKSSLDGFCDDNCGIARLSDFIQHGTDLKGIVLTIKRNTERQIELNTLSRSQRRLYDLVNTLQEHMKETMIVYADEKYTLWDFPDTFRYKEDPSKPTFEDAPTNGMAKKVGDDCNRIISILESVSNTGNIFLKIYYYFCERTLGHADYMRVELEHNYRGERTLIESYDRTRIDAMLIRKQESSAREGTGNTQAELGTTVVFCNPNAGYYEYAYDFQDQWMEFYTGRGLNVMLWNYRGYGRSQSRPTPKRAMLDGEYVVKYLREVRGVKKIIVHGESLGGAVASYLAWKCGCDFLFADRTFGNIEEVAGVSFGSIAKSVFRKVTNWHFAVTSSYLQANCYKVVGSDPCDATIPELASLKTEISRFITLQQKLRQSSSSSSSSASHSACSSSCSSPSKTFNATPLSPSPHPARALKLIEQQPLQEVSSLDQPDFCHILTCEQVHAFYQHLSFLHNLVHDPAHKLRSAPKRRLETAKTLDPPLESISVQKSGNDDFAATLPKDASARSVVLSQDAEKYCHIRKDEPTDSEGVALALAAKLISKLDEVDSAGTTLSRIMKDSKRHHEDLIKAFLANIDVWGSHPPSKIESSYQPISKLSELRAKAYSKVKKVKKEMVKEIEGYKGIDATDAKTFIIRKVVENAEAIIGYVAKLEDFLEHRQKAASRKSSTDSKSGLQGEIEAALCSKQSSTKLQSLSDSVGGSEEFTGKPSASTELPMLEGEPADESVIGSLLPLNCGHNGVLRYAELNQYEKHLVTAGIIPR